MQRLIAVIAVVMTLLTGTLSGVLAQEDGTPAAGGDATGSIIYGSDGQEEGTVSVAEVVDPFEDFDTSYSPQRGFHFVMAVVTVEASADKDIEASPYGFYLVDTDGFSYYQTFTYRSTELTQTLPDFIGGTVPAGESVSGAIFFEVLDGTTPGLITYQPSYDRLVTAADLRDEPVTPGDDVEYLDASGKPAATITVNDVILPLKDTTSDPQRGSEFAGVEVTIENVGSEPFTVEPYGFNYVDTEGFVYINYGIYRSDAAEADVPTLQSADLAPGESVTGMLSFEVFAGSGPGFIFYSPTGDRHVRVAEYGDAVGGVTGEKVDIPVAQVTPEATIESSPECQEVLDWGKETVANIGAWAQAVGTISPALNGGDLDPQVARDAADAIADVSGDQDDIDAPDLAADANDLVVALFDDSVAAVNDLADALESGDKAEIADAVAAINDLGSDTYLGPLNDEIDALTVTCPALDTIG